MRTIDKHQKIQKLIDDNPGLGEALRGKSMFAKSARLALVQNGWISKAAIDALLKQHEHEKRSERDGPVFTRVVPGRQQVVGHISSVYCQFGNFKIAIITDKNEKLLGPIPLNLMRHWESAVESGATALGVSGYLMTKPVSFWADCEQLPDKDFDIFENPTDGQILE